MLRTATALVLLGLVGCGSPAPEGAHALMDFTLAGGFYSAPFPDQSRLVNGKVDLSKFPNPQNNSYAKTLIALAAASTNGFGTTSTIYFAFDSPLDPTKLPPLSDTVGSASTVFLISVDPRSSDLGTRYPIAVHFLSEGGPYGASNLLALLPLQGAPLRPNTLYAAGVTRNSIDAKGRSLGVAPQMAQLASGARPDGMSDSAFADYQTALSQLTSAVNVTPDSLAALTVFRTGDPTAGLRAVARDALSRPLPTVAAPWTRDEAFDGYCVYHTTIAMPDYQSGVPPFTMKGGDWQFDSSGNPILQRMETAGFVITVPRQTMPPNGFPIVIFERAGGGGDRPLVDRGPSLGSTFTNPVMPGTGPAQELAKIGFAGASIDGPLEGLRNTTNGNEDFLIFNVLNPTAMRDNVRQSSLELIVTAHLMDNVTVDASDCPGVTAPNDMVKFDTSTMALMGHSMGATIAPPAIALEPRYRALVMSGAGGSWIENIVYKQKPLAVKPLAEALIGLTGDYSLTDWDPLLSLLQWAGESADPPVYSRALTREGTPPRDVLMFQGIVDHYILPPIANAESLSLGLDLAGPERDTGVPEIAKFTPLGTLLPLAGRSPIMFPAMNNFSVAGGKATAVVTQHLSDGIEDGHEIMFQLDEPKHEYRCFLQGLVNGSVRVPAPGPDCN